MKIRNNQYLEDNKKTIAKFKLINEKLEAEYTLKIRKLIENCDITKQNLGFIDKIKNKENILELNEIIYNTYDNYTNNYYNSLSINNLLLYYNNNPKINNKMRKIFGDKYEKIINIRKKKFNEDRQIKLEEELNKTKEENKELDQKNKELENRLNSIIEENKRKIEEEKRKINEILKEKNYELKVLNNKLKDYKIKNNSLELEIRNMNEKNNILEEEKSKMKEDLNKIKKINERLSTSQEQIVIIVFYF